MAYPLTLSNIEDNISDLMAAHINNLEKKVGVNGSADEDSLDFKVANMPAKEDVINKENTTLDTSTVKYPTNRLTKEYVDSKLLDGPTPYIHLGMSANEAVDIGWTVNFDTVRSSSVLTRNGYGVNVQAGKTYRLQAYVNTVASTPNNYLGYQFYFGITPIGQNAFSIEAVSAQAYSFKAPLFMYYTPSVDGIVYVKIVDDSIGTGLVAAGWNTSFIVEQVIGMKGDKGDIGDVSVSDIVFEGWTTPTFQNGWLRYDNTVWAPEGYCKDSLGFVHLKGLIRAGVVGAAAFTLPVGYRPANRSLFPSISNNLIGRVDVDTDGTVNPVAPSSNAWVTLDGIIFKAA